MNDTNNPTNNPDSLAGKVLERLAREEATEVEPERPDQWGIDESGFPWPNPVNAQAVAIRIFSKWGKVNGVDNIYKIEDDIFLGGKRLQQNRPTLLSLYEQPKIIVWANTTPELHDEAELWEQIKRTIFSEWPIVWAIIKEVAPEYNRDYIRVTKDIIWGKDEADLFIS